MHLAASRNTSSNHRHHHPLPPGWPPHVWPARNSELHRECGSAWANERPELKALASKLQTKQKHLCSTWRMRIIPGLVIVSSYIISHPHGKKAMKRSFGRGIIPSYGVLSTIVAFLLSGIGISNILRICTVCFLGIFHDIPIFLQKKPKLAFIPQTSFRNGNKTLLPDMFHMSHPDWVQVRGLGSFWSPGPTAKWHTEKPPTKPLLKREFLELEPWHLMARL